MATVWAAMLPTDPELRRRKKTAIRIGQLAIVVMLTFAAAVRTMVDKHHPPLPPQGIELIFASFAYAIWLLYGLRTTVQWMLCEHAHGSHGLWPSARGAQAF